MRTCAHTFHPLIHETGISQAKRSPEALDPGRLKVDGHSITDLMDFVLKLAPHINHYDNTLMLGDWSGFFSHGIPFLNARIASIDPEGFTREYQKISTLVEEEQRTGHLQWVIDFLYSEMIKPWLGWNQALVPTNSSLSLLINKLIRGELASKLKIYIALVNGAAKHYGLKKPNFDGFLNDEDWQLDFNGLFAINDSFVHAPGGVNGRLLSLKSKLDGVFGGFMEALKLVQAHASGGRFQQAGLFVQGDALDQQHPAHLGLFFTYIKLYQKFQNGLNELSAKHLDYFYQRVLCLKPNDPHPDQAHILFELQKQVNKYHLPQDTFLKDGKDLNGIDILFGLDEDIVVNKTQVADLKTLFLHYVDLYENCDDPLKNLIKGVYMAPVANSLDGQGAAFEDEGAKNWDTLGSRESKQLIPQSQQHIDHPYARIGFVLASPVLLLKEGKRTITVDLDLAPVPGSNVSDLDFNKLINIINAEFYFLTSQTLEEATKDNLSGDASAVALALLAQDSPYLVAIDPGGVNPSLPSELSSLGFANEDIDRLEKHLEKRQVFKVSLSGEKAWILPSQVNITLTTAPFNLNLEITLAPDLPAVTFFDPEVLEEKLDTNMPVLKVELDQDVKVVCDGIFCQPDCCLERCRPAEKVELSVYEFLKSFEIANDPTIDVEVCGVKDLIVQNDESLMDVNSAIFPFGTRPDIMDFNVVNPLKLYFINQELIDQADTNGITAATKTQLETLLSSSPTDIYRIGSTQKDLNDFLATINPASDRDILRVLLDTSTFTPNLVGPNFYIGSKEAFCKAWEQVWININWKDKPSDFNEYYKAYVVKGVGTNKIYGLNEDDFEVNVAMRRDLQWHREQVNNLNIDHDLATAVIIEPNPSTNHNNRYLFKSSLDTFNCTDFYDDPDGHPTVEQTIQLSSDNFFADSKFQDVTRKLEAFTVDTPDGFVRLTLENQDFLHKDYPFVLARQMMAFGRFPDEKIDDAVYEDTLGAPHVFNLDFLFIDLQQVLIDIGKQIVDDSLDQIFVDLEQAVKDLVDTVNFNIDLTDLLTAISNVVTHIGLVTIAGNVLQAANKDELKTIYDNLHSAFVEFLDLAGTSIAGVETRFKEIIETKITNAVNALNNIDLFGTLPDAQKVLIPNEPYTPTIKEISLDYTAQATKDDIDLIHLYPYKDTFKVMDLLFNPRLLPTHSQEGSLFLGLKNLDPGSNLQLLFQLAETTADTEVEEAEVAWHYLKNNQWEPLRSGFEILNDDTDGFTKSGIVKMAVPADIALNNYTIMPEGLAWIRASVAERIGAVAEAINIHTQAVKATFSIAEENDTSRLREPLEAGSISKLQVADANIKQVQQPYGTFNGKPATGNFFRRVSEHLRHKGRGITAFDYQRLVLEAFPAVYLAKCIQHTLALSAHQYISDLELAPGFVLVAVIPDPTHLVFEDRFTPKLPASQLNRIRDYLKERISPFIRLKVENPRYEGIRIKLEVQLVQGKDRVFHEEKLEEELRLFLSPWVNGDFSQLTFGRSISRSSLIKFIEGRDYVDYICSLEIIHAEDLDEECMPPSWNCENEHLEQKDQTDSISPKTARSILVAGEIKICPSLDNPCPSYEENSEFECDQSITFHDCEKVKHEKCFD